jgi:hypothetical protein
MLDQISDILRQFSCVTVDNRFSISPPTFENGGIKVFTHKNNLFDFCRGNKIQNEETVEYMRLLFIIHEEMQLLALDDSEEALNIFMTETKKLLPLIEKNSLFSINTFTKSDNRIKADSYATMYYVDPDNNTKTQLFNYPFLTFRTVLHPDTFTWQLYLGTLLQASRLLTDSITHNHSRKTVDRKDIINKVEELSVILLKETTQLASTLAAPKVTCAA